MTRFIFSLQAVLLLTCLFAGSAVATSTQYGDSGLFSQPVAQTLNEGNICIGLWANCTEGMSSFPGSSDTSQVVPATITMGLGTFMEAYGSYPNLLFNDDEEASGRGFANAGFKFRVHGKRSAPFRLAVDLQGRRSVSANPELDGLTDYVSRLVASFKLADTVAIHANAGYSFNDSPRTISYDDQVLLGAGIEYSLATRLRLIAEVSAESEKISGYDEPSEVTAGLQYFVTPHLTMNLGMSMGLSDSTPDWRILAGLSTCQGIGTYNKPVPKLVNPKDIDREPIEPVTVSKIKALTPLLSKIAVAKSPISHLEVPVDDPDHAIIINPADRLQTPSVKPLSVSPMGPLDALKKKRKTDLPDQPFLAKVSRQFRFPEVVFSYNKWGISEEGRRSLSLVADELRRQKTFFIISVEGHTDNIGSENYNQTLSFRRAVATATHLVLRDGFDPARIFVKGYGESRPIANNETEEGRARNRRVELLILVPNGYENIRMDSKDDSTKGRSSLYDEQTIDPLSIEQAITDKTGRGTGVPAGTVSRTGNERQKTNEGP